MVLAALIEAHPDGLTRSELRHKLTLVENSPARIAAIGHAFDGLIEVGLVVRGDDRLQPTPVALRAGELELGL